MTWVQDETGTWGETCKFTGCLSKEKAAQECHTEELKVCKSLM